MQNTDTYHRKWLLQHRRKEQKRNWFFQHEKRNNLTYADRNNVCKGYHIPQVAKVRMAKGKLHLLHKTGLVLWTGRMLKSQTQKDFLIFHGLEKRLWIYFLLCEHEHMVEMRCFNIGLSRHDKSLAFHQKRIYYRHTCFSRALFSESLCWKLTSSLFHHN